MAKRLSVLISDDIYNQIVKIRDADEVQTIMEHVRTALKLYIWYREQTGSGFKVYSQKEEKDRTIVREVFLS
ncbi:MAG: hypothetical protein ACM3WV_11010 [Bacillota bacterium]